MKRNILLEASKLVTKVPGVSNTGSTATAGTYIKAYDDYHESINLFSAILYNLENAENLKKTINRYKGKPNYEIDELEESMNISNEKVEQFYSELKEFIEKRIKESWR